MTSVGDLGDSGGNDDSDVGRNGDEEDSEAVEVLTMAANKAGL